MPQNQGMEYKILEQGKELEKYQEMKAGERVSLVAVPNDIAVIGAYSFAECRNIKEICLPNGITKIGKHAFYNCRGLEKITLPGKVLEIEDGAFKNCASLSYMIFINTIPNDNTIKHALHEMSQDINIEIHYVEDKKKSTKKAKLFFPKFDYEYIANEPARIFSEVGHGAGYLYQQCFFQFDVDYKKYDEVFSTAIITEKLDTIMNIVINRLQFPYQLSEMSRINYIQWLKENWTQIVIWFIKEEKKEIMKLLIELKEFTMEEIEEAISLASKEHKAEFIISLLEYKHKYFGRKEKIFEL